MKPIRIIKAVLEPIHWAEIPWGEKHRTALENHLRSWFAKIYGFHMLKIGNFSAEINTENCDIPHQVNVSLAGQPKQVKADPLHLPFLEKSVDVCLLAHTITWCQDPHNLLREVNRVLIDDGWLILSGFNPLSLIGLFRFIQLFYHKSPYHERMFTLARQIDWLSLLNFEVLYYSRFQVLPWSQGGDGLLNTHFPALGCMQVIVARKRAVPLTLNVIMKHNKIKMQLRPAISTTRKYPNYN